MNKITNKAQSSFEHSSYPILYRDIVQTEEFVQMQDGAKLRTIIVRPKGAHITPCILSRSCYHHDETIYLQLAEQYALRGISFVIQYCRGTGGSEGDWQPNVNERSDGKTTVDWLASQPWAGALGYLGSSYLALTGWIIADILPPQMKTMYLSLYGTDRHTSAYKDGLFRHDVLTAWAMGNAGFAIDADYTQSCLYRPHAQVDTNLWGKQLDWYRDWVTNPSQTAPYWQTGMWKTLQDIPAKVNIPILISEGWYDHHLGSAIKSYNALGSKATSHFIIGPWNHWFEAPLENDQGKNYECNDILRAFEWFYNILVREETPKAKVAKYVIKGDYWIESDKLVNAEQKGEIFYLSGGYNGLVYDKDEIIEGRQSYVYDPENPIASHGGETLLKSKGKEGSRLQPKPNYRDDVISFVSAPLKEDIVIDGEIKINLQVSSTAKDTAFVAKIMDVDEKGNAYNIRGAVTTLAYRNNSDVPQKYEPNSVVDIVMSTWHIAYKLQRGHRLRIDIQSSDFPQYAVHTNTEGVWSEQVSTEVATQTVFCGGGAFVVLPCLFLGGSYVTIDA